MALQGYAITQMQRWALPPNQINFGGTPTASTISGASSGTYTISNGAYDENGNLMFYVKDDEVFDATSTSVGYLSSYFNPSNGYSYSFVADEIAIVPFPNQCNMYFLIYTKSVGPLVGSALMYSIVDMSTGSPVVTSSSGSSSPQLLGTYSDHVGSIAVSKPIDSYNTRYLYTIGYPNVDRYTITTLGIGGKTTLTSYSTVGDVFWSYEAELNHGGTKLAWTSTNSGLVHMLNLSTLAHTTYSVPIDPSCSGSGMYYTGLEFDAYDNLFVAGSKYGCTPNTGVFKIPNGGGTITKVPGSDNYHNTQLELGNDGYIYGVNNTNSKLGKFLPSSGSMSASPLTFNVTSNGPSAGGLGYLYHLPDQIDGDLYFYFKGVNMATPDFQINSQAVSSTPLELYNCNPITLNNLSSNVYQYQVIVQSTDASGNPISGGGFLGTYTSTWQYSCPTNLLSLPGTNGTWLADPSHAGYYTVTLKVRNTCYDVWETSGRIHLNTPPSAASMNLQINNGITGTPCYTQNIASVCPTGAYSATYNIGTSTFGSNNITSYFRKIYKVDCSTGANISVVYTDFSPVPVPNPSSSATALSLNAISISGGTGYFTNKVGECYKLTITVYNQCSNAVDWTFFEIDGYYKNDGTTGVVNEVALTNELNVYPNPFSSNVQIVLSLANDSPVSAYLMDAQGKIVRSVVENEPLAAGEHMLNISGDNLAGGIYMYKVVTNTNTYSGRVLKAE